MHGELTLSCMQTQLPLSPPSPTSCSWSQHGELYSLDIFALVARFSVHTDGGAVTLCEARRKTPDGRFETKWLPHAFREKLLEETAPQRSDASGSEASATEVRQPEIRQTEIRQTEVRQPEIRQTEVRQADVRHADVRQTAALSRKLLAALKQAA